MLRVEIGQSGLACGSLNNPLNCKKSILPFANPILTHYVDPPPLRLYNIIYEICDFVKTKLEIVIHTFPKFSLSKTFGFF